MLDVNALVALGAVEHEFHRATAEWASTLKPEDRLVTCAVTELGFVRILGHAPLYGFTVDQARALLVRLKNAGAVRFDFLSDDQDVSGLPAWVKTPKQVTDGHLVQLAKANGAVLATLDGRIPGAFVIPRKA